MFHRSGTATPQAAADIDLFDFDESVKSKLWQLKMEENKEANGNGEKEKHDDSNGTKSDEEDDEKKPFHAPLDMFAENSDMFAEKGSVSVILLQMT